MPYWEIKAGEFEGVFFLLEYHESEVAKWFRRNYQSEVSLVDIVNAKITMVVE